MSRKALIIESADGISKLIAPALGQRGYAVTSAQCAASVLDNLKNGAKFDLVIVGEDLEDIDGISALARLRPASPKSKFVFVANSWKAPELYKEIRKSLNVDIVLHRPLKVSLVVAQLDALFENQQDAAPEGADQDLIVKRSQLQYIKNLPTRIGEIASALEQCRSSDSRPSDAGRLAHNLKGTSLSYGLDAVGVKAAVVEELCLRATANGDTDIRWNEIDDAFGALKLLVERIGTQTAAGRSEADVVVGEAGLRASELDPGPPAALHAIYCGAEYLPLKPLAIDRTAEILQVRDPHQVVDKSYVVAADALLFDTRHFDQNECFEIARQLRNLEGNETLPLGFVLKDPSADARAQAVHSGASVSLDPDASVDAVLDSLRYLLSIRRPDKQRVLAIDDDPDFCALVTGILSDNGIHARSLCKPEEAESVLESWQPDLLLLDVNMPGISGYELCRRIRSSARWQELPIVFLTAQAGLDARLAAFQAGGDDYLPKPVADVELLMRVKVRLDRLRLLRERADKDVLTGLLLRRAFLENLESIMAESKRYELGFCIGLIDIDHFKQVNDSRGHLTGDRVLVHFGDLLKKRFRVEDLRGRWGGEEFILALRRANRRSMAPALVRILQELKSMSILDDQQNEFHVSFSAGMADYPEDGTTIRDLIHAADERLYIAKRSGRSRVVIAEGDEYA